MFQYEASFASLFDLCRNGFDGKKWRTCDERSLRTSPPRAGGALLHHAGAAYPATIPCPHASGIVNLPLFQKFRYNTFYNDMQ